MIANQLRPVLLSLGLFCLTAEASLHSRIGYGCDDRSNRESRKILEFDVKINGDAQVVESVIELTELRCFSESEIVCRIKNELGVTIASDHVTTSCGCITQLPPEWSVKEGETEELRFVITMPKNEETFERYVTMSDSSLGRSIRITVKCKAKPSLKLDNLRVEVVSEDKQTVKVPIKTSFEEIDLTKLTVQCQSSESVSAMLHAKDSSAGELWIEVTPNSEAADGVQSFCQLDFQFRGKSVAICSIPIRYPNRTVVKPNKIKLSTESKPAAIPLVVYSIRLHESLKKEERVSATLVINGKPTADKIECVAKATDSPISTLRISMPSVVAKSLAGHKCEVAFKTGGWTYSLPVETDQGK